MRSLALAVACLLAGVAAPAGAAPTPARTVCHLHDARIDEASGLARGIASPGVFWVQNDSGDTNRIFAVDTRSCRTAATVTVSGARNVDWEDLAVARDRDGTPSVWIGDLGDNDARRAQVQVYRIPEPRVPAGAQGLALTAGPAAVWRLRYPDGPVDAESLAVAPGGAAYAVTKSVVGSSVVYRLPARPDPDRVQAWQRVAALRFAPVGTSRFGLPGALLATGAAFSADGRRLAVRTYSGAFVWTVGGAGVAAALRAAPATVALPAQPQGEGIAVDGQQLLLDSEGAGTAILSVPAPVARPAARATAASSSAPGSGSPSPARNDGHGGSWWPGVVVLVLAVVGAVSWWLAQRSGRARGGEH